MLRSAAITVALVLVLAACMQTPDYVAGSAALDTAGVGGASGASGSGGGLPEDCDPVLTRTVILFQSIEGTCTYASSHEELDQLLTDIIYTQPARELTPVEVEMMPDMVCRLARELVPGSPDLRWHFAIEGTDLTREDFTTKVICPRYCVALREWLIANRDRALSCVPGAEP